MTEIPDTNGSARDKSSKQLPMTNPNKLLTTMDKDTIPPKTAESTVLLANCREKKLELTCKFFQNNPPFFAVTLN